MERLRLAAREARLRRELDQPVVGHRRQRAAALAQLLVDLLAVRLRDAHLATKRVEGGACAGSRWHALGNTASKTASRQFDRVCVYVCVCAARPTLLAQLVRVPD